MSLFGNKYICYSTKLTQLRRWKLDHFKAESYPILRQQSNLSSFFCINSDKELILGENTNTSFMLMTM